LRWSTINGTTRFCGGGSIIRVSSTHESLMGSKLRSQFLLRKRPIVDLGSFGLRLADGTRVETQFDLLAAFVICNVRCGNTFHAENFYFITIPTRKRILDSRKIFGFQLVNLLDVNGKTTSCVQTSRAQVALEMLRLLVLHEDFLILELPLTVPAPRPDDLLILFLCHVV